MKYVPKRVAQSFKGARERMPSKLGWVIVRIPLDVPKVWGTRGMLRVKGEINGFAFRTSLFPTGRGYHYLLINKRMQAGARAAPGDTAQFHLESDTEERKAIVPAELQRFLAQDRALRRWFDKLNYSPRKWIGDPVTEQTTAAPPLRPPHHVPAHLLPPLPPD